MADSEQTQSPSPTLPKPPRAQGSVRETLIPCRWISSVRGSERGGGVLQPAILFVCSGHVTISIQTRSPTPLRDCSQAIIRWAPMSDPPLPSPLQSPPDFPLRPPDLWHNPMTQVSEAVNSKFRNLTLGKKEFPTIHTARYCNVKKMFFLDIYIKVCK